MAMFRWGGSDYPDDYEKCDLCGELHDIMCVRPPCLERVLEASADEAEVKDGG